MSEVPSQSQDVLYQPGISFRNPKVVRPVTMVRTHPWFEGDQAVGPLSAANKLKRWDLSRNLRRYSPVWGREMKQRNVEKLGGVFHGLPTMEALGQAPPATSETSAVTRSPLGFLENLVKIGTNVATGVTDVLQNQAEQKRQVAVAQAQAYAYPSFLPSGDNSSWLWIAGIGAVGLGAILYLRR